MGNNNAIIVAVPVTDLVQEFLLLEESILAEKDADVTTTLRQQQLLVVSKIKELRPLQDPMLIIDRYRT